MTNGEKLKEIFPNLRIIECKYFVGVMGENYEFNNTYPLKWWNAEYKEPITCKDCKSRKCNDAGDYYCDITGGYYEPDYHCKDAKRK